MNYLIRGDIRLENVLISVKIIKNYNMSYIKFNIFVQRLYCFLNVIFIYKFLKYFNFFLIFLYSCDDVKFIYYLLMVLLLNFKFLVIKILIF